MFHLFGYFLIVLLVQSSLSILDTDASFYFDEVAILLVLGGTLTTGIVTFPFSDFMSLSKVFFRFLEPTHNNYKNMATKFIKLAEKNLLSRTSLVDATKDNQIDDFTRQGIELIVSGLSKDEVEDILVERSYQEFIRDDKLADMLRKLSKYPPAFGLIGTVLGLVSLMRTIGDGGEASEVGLKMALALVATLYGLTFANFVIVPIAENITLRSKEKKKYREAQIEGLLMIYEKKSPLAVQEMMNCFLDEKNRVDLIGVKVAS